MSYDNSGALSCDMERECADEVTYIDESGFIYCMPHGRSRQAWKRCRKMRPAEMKRLKAGKPLERF